MAPKKKTVKEEVFNEVEVTEVMSPELFIERFTLNPSGRFKVRTEYAAGVPIKKVGAILKELRGK